MYTPALGGSHCIVCTLPLHTHYIRRTPSTGMETAFPQLPCTQTLMIWMASIQFKSFSSQEKMGVCGKSPPNYGSGCCSCPNLGTVCTLPCTAFPILSLHFLPLRLHWLRSCEHTTYSSELEDSCFRSSSISSIFRHLPLAMWARPTCPVWFAVDSLARCLVGRPAGRPARMHAPCALA